MTVDAPDFVQPRTGWRVWEVVEVDGELRLSSLVYRTIWHPRGAAVARCRRPLAALPWGRLPLHGPPSFDCLCGIYAVDTPGQALPYLTYGRDGEGRPARRVIGLVSLWGRIVEGEHGCRSAYAYPALIAIPPAGRSHGPWRSRSAWFPSAEIVERLTDYAVPVELLAEVDEAHLVSLGSVTSAC
jgi:hypothetical protein